MQNSSQAIVFGGAGFIGTHLLKSLLQSGKYDCVVSVDIAPPRQRVEGIEYIHHDVRQPIPLDLGRSGPSDLFNLAAIHTTPGHPDGDYYNTNVLGAVNVCKFASETGSQNIAFTSSISVYGPSELPLDEDTPPAPVSAYGRSKLAAESIHRLWQSERANRRLTIVRPAVIYGLYEQGNFTRLARLLSRGLFVYPGRTDTIKSCGYVKDLVSSMIFMASRNTDVSIYNFSHSHRYTIQEICAAFCRASGYRIPKLVIPVWLMNLAVTPFEILQTAGLRTGINRQRIHKLWFSTNIVPKQLVASGFEFQYGLEDSLREWKGHSAIADFE